MKKIINGLLLCITLLFSSPGHAALDPKLKMMVTMAGYGIVGGALLGTASLAFDTGGRSIAKGASLGLYAGLLFGGYVILNYEMKKRGFGQEEKGDFYPNSSSPYEDGQSQYERMNLESYKLAQFEIKKDSKQNKSLFFLNFFQHEF